jgi:hypothetical protein
MNAAESKRIEDFLGKWLGSEGNERANYRVIVILRTIVSLVN